MIVCVFALDNAIRIELDENVERTSSFVACLAAVSTADVRRAEPFRAVEFGGPFGLLGDGAPPPPCRRVSAGDANGVAGTLAAPPFIVRDDLRSAKPSGTTFASP